MRAASLVALAVAFAAAWGCSRKSNDAAPAASTSAPSTSSSVANAPADPAPPPPALEKELDAALVAIDAGDWAAADQHLKTADGIAAGDAHFSFFVARVRATRFAESGDYEAAAAAILAVIPALAKHPELHDEFSAHNAMMMIRTAQGDPAAALAEDDQATLCAARGTWDPDTRETLAFQKDRWHRAYLTRMLAESRTGTAKEALVLYARAALDEYRSHGGFPDSVAVLDAYFAALDGRRDDALAAARRVDLTQDDDIEDLYLVVVGLEAGGDAKGAAKVRAAMRAPSEPRVSRAVMVRWLDLDAKWPDGGGFTPLHAGKHD